MLYQSAEHYRIIIHEIERTTRQSRLVFLLFSSASVLFRHDMAAITRMNNNFANVHCGHVSTSPNEGRDGHPICKALRMMGTSQSTP